MKKYMALALAAASISASAARTESLLTHGWSFSRDSAKWESVTIPHDWAIYGPFDRSYDLQNVAITQNGETEASVKTGRTGGLPYVGKGYYRTTFNLPDTTDRSAALLFDGAMSNARVYVNGRQVAYWPYGYNAFEARLDGVAHPGENSLEVSLENLPESSRWYPGAGLYRNVRLIETSRIHVPVWGTQLTTPYVSDEYATVHLRTTMEGTTKGEKITLRTSILNADGRQVAADTHEFTAYPGVTMDQNFVVKHPGLWTPETPTLYTAVTDVIKDGVTVDKYSTRFGIRSIEVRNGEGFFLNGKKTQFRGVCLHHDLGPLGAAVNRSAVRHQLRMLKDMGANAVRTSHNMPAQELVELCDEMGLMMMVEAFDDWDYSPKTRNSYATLFNDWAVKDVKSMVRHFRNNPSVMMWSIGNEIPSQYWQEGGVGQLRMLQDAAHRLDPTRTVTCGMDHIDAVLDTGFAAALDVPGFNYRVHRYKDALPRLPQNIIMGSETASTVSSRGQYFFPVKIAHSVTRPGNQSSGYDVEYCSWSNLPDDDFAAEDDIPNNLGQFVWTGFDYLGEPSPYDTDAWPSHSSYFGIIDLASIPKDRYWLYRSKWNKNDRTLHILPHWTWPGREGEVTPVFVYTDSPKAELFLNGKSLGIRGKNDSTPQTRYRLMWNDVRYEPGELRVVAYDSEGRPAGEKTVRTAGKPYRLVLSSDTRTLSADGDDLAYVTVTVVDKDGNPCPTATDLVKFSVKGQGKYRAAANGDPTSLDLFHLPQMPLFSGAATAIVQSGTRPGTVTLKASAKGLRSAEITFNVTQ